MACNIHLYPLNAGSPPNGRWFLTSAPPGFGALYVSCTEMGSYDLQIGLPDDNIPIDNGCANLYDLWIQPPEPAGTYVFKFVSPDTEDASACGSSECGGCAEYVIVVDDVPETIDAEEKCTNSSLPENLFDLAGLDCTEWDIAYNTGSPTDPDFNLSGTCGVDLGDFSADNITPDVYEFLFTRIGGLEDCTECELIFELTISSAPFLGYDQSGSVCLV